jgi:predicted dithiol-disulfide oxidoreductase (DUF899 family)
MSYEQTSKQINEFRAQIAELRGKMQALQGDIAPQEVEDYTFKTLNGDVKLSELFGDKDHLFVVHNMGAGCTYCTLWADGFNGILGHLENRAAFVVASPQTPEQQETFKASRGWNFRMVSQQGTSFAGDMGYGAGDAVEPGVSVFKREGDKILRVSDAHFGPGDDFCAMWHFIDLIPQGAAAGWQPQYKYG